VIAWSNYSTEVNQPRKREAELAEFQVALVALTEATANANAYQEH
jgi:hypothetical protein